MKCAREIVWSGLVAIAAVSAFGAGMLQPGTTPASKPSDSVIAPPSPRDARDLGLGRYVADASGEDLSGKKTSWRSGRATSSPPPSTATR